MAMKRFVLSAVVALLLFTLFAPSRVFAVIAGTASRWVGNNLVIEGYLQLQFADAGVIWSQTDHTTTLVVDGAGTVAGRSIAVSSPSDGGAASQYEEHGNCTLVASACTGTFKNAFATAPQCTCSHIAAIPLPCGFTAFPSTASALIAVPTGAGVASWSCKGDR